MIDISGPMYYSNYLVELDRGKININLFGDHHFSKKNQCSDDSNSYHIAEFPFHLAKSLSRHGQTLDYYLESPYFLQRGEVGTRFEISPHDPTLDLKTDLLRQLGFTETVTAGEAVFMHQFLSKSFGKNMLDTPLVRARRQVYHCLQCQQYLREVSRELPYDSSEEPVDYIDRFHQTMKHRCGDYYEHCRPNLRIHVNDIRAGLQISLPDAATSRVSTYYQYFSVIMGYKGVYDLAITLANLPKMSILEIIVDNYSTLNMLNTTDARCRLTALLWKTFDILDDNAPAIKWFIDDVEMQQLYDNKNQTMRKKYVEGHVQHLKQHSSQDSKFLSELMGSTVYLLVRRIILTGRSKSKTAVEDTNGELGITASEIHSLPWLWHYLTSLQLEELVGLQESQFSPQAVLDWLSAHGGLPIVDYVTGLVDQLIGNIYDFEVNTRNIRQQCLDLQQQDRCYVDPELPGDNILTQFFNTVTNPFLNPKIHNRELNEQFVTAIRRFKGHCLREIRSLKYPSVIGDTTFINRKQAVERFRVRFFLEMEQKGNRQSMFVKIREMSGSILKSYSLVMDFYTVMRVSRRMCDKYMRRCMQSNNYPSPYDQPQLQDNIIYYAGSAHIEVFEQFLKFLGMERGITVNRHQELSNKCTYIHPTIANSETVEIGDEAGLSRLINQGYEPVRCQSVRREWLTGVASSPRERSRSPPRRTVITVAGIRLDHRDYDHKITALQRLDREGVNLVVNPPRKSNMTEDQLGHRSATYAQIKDILPDDLTSDSKVRTQFRLEMIQRATGITKRSTTL